MEHDVFWIPIVAIAGSFVMVVAVIWLVTRSKQRGAQYRAEVQMKMIDKFGSSAEFVKFLESPAGREFLQPQRSARDRVMAGIRTGIILLFLGLGFSIGFVAEHDTGFFVPAFILGALGLGFLVSSAISWKLSKRLDNSTAQPPAQMT